MTVILEKLCASTYTTAQLHHRLSLLQECLEEVFYHTNELSKSTNELPQLLLVHLQTIGSKEDVEAFTHFQDVVASSFQPHTFIETIGELRKESETLPVLTLYVPVHFTDDAIAVVGLWCRANLNKKMMLDVHIDPDAIGGCRFVTNDVYHDFSFSHFMKNAKGVVSELLTTYA